MPPESAATAPSLSAGRPIEELLLPVVPGSLHQRALPLAAVLADAWRLPIRLIHVSNSISSDDQDLEAVLNGIRSWYPSIAVSSEHVFGDDPAKAIAEQLRPQTLTVLATDHIDKWRFKDSAAESLVNQAGIPVVLLGPNVTKDSVRHGALKGEIVVGLDGSIAAESALEPAIGLARSTGRRVWLVNVAAQPDTGDAMSMPKPGHYLQEVAERYEPEVNVRWEVIQSNDPVEALEAFAERRQARFVVMSTGGRTDPTNHSMASIALGVVSVSARPVLVVKSLETSTLDVG
ncbi:MAG: universal stress protein [Acidimicrobiales bacterium]